MLCNSRDLAGTPSTRSNQIWYQQWKYNFFFTSILQHSLSLLLNGHQSYCSNNFYQFLSSSFYRPIPQVLSNTELFYLSSFHNPWNNSDHIKELIFNSYKIKFVNPPLFHKGSCLLKLQKDADRGAINASKQTNTWNAAQCQFATSR